MLFRVYDRLTTWLLALSGLVMFGLSIVNALLRYFLNMPLGWGEEISRYAMVWGTLIGVVIAYRVGQHVAITLLVDALPARAVLILRIVSHGLTLLTAFVLFWSGHALINIMGDIFAPSSDIPMVWVYAAFPVCAVMLAFEALRLLARDLRGTTTEGAR